MPRRLIGVVLLAAAAVVVATVMTGRPAPAPDRTPTGADIDQAADQRFEKVVASMWWHQPRFATRLDLSEKLIASMDRHCLHGLRRRHSLREQVRRGSDDYRRALAGGDLAAAAAAIDRLAEPSAELGLIEERLTLEILALLSPGQLEVLRREHSVLLERPWLRTLGRDRPGRRPVKDRDAAGENE